MIEKTIEKPFYTNEELAKILDISSITVGRYIRQSEKQIKDGLKPVLDLVKTKSGFKINKTDDNLVALKGLIGVKDNFKNKAKYKTIEPTKEFLDTFTTSEIDEITVGLLNNKILAKFYYMGNGANLYNDGWGGSEVTNKFNTCFFNQLHILIEFAEKNNCKFNLIELGAARMPTSTDFVKKLYSLDLVEKYVAIDISDKMLDVTQEEFEKNFPSRLFQGEILDFENDSLDKIIMSLRKNNPKAVNILFATGGTMANSKNLEYVIDTFSKSLHKSDFFSYDSLRNFKVKKLMVTNEKSQVNSQGSFFVHMIKMLGIEDEDFIIYREYNPDNEKNVGYNFCEFTKNICIEINGEEIKYEKGSRIKILRFGLANIVKDVEMCENLGLSIVSLGASYDNIIINYLYQKQ
jgi:Histidine-specific methyltransferase, SAM-dependent